MERVNQLIWSEKDGAWTAQGTGRFEYSFDSFYIRVTWEDSEGGKIFEIDGWADDERDKAYCQSHHDAICSAIEEAVRPWKQLVYHSQHMTPEDVVRKIEELEAQQNLEPQHGGNVQCSESNEKGATAPIGAGAVGLSVDSAHNAQAGSNPAGSTVVCPRCGGEGTDPVIDSISFMDCTMRAMSPLSV